jgi:hypothetical protein
MSTMEANTDNELSQILSLDAQIDALAADDVKDMYVRVRLAREASGYYTSEELVEWLTDTEDYLGTFANKFGIDVDTWGGDVVEQLWSEFTTDKHSEETKIEAIRESLKADATGSVGMAYSKVLRALV